MYAFDNLELFVIFTYFNKHFDVPIFQMVDEYSVSGRFYLSWLLGPYSG